MPDRPLKYRDLRRFLAAFGVWYVKSVRRRFDLTPEHGVSDEAFYQD